MHYDVAVIGGGIAGLSVAAWLAPRCSVVVIESEDTLGYHATGRSAAAYTECYGSRIIRLLAQASRQYLVAADDLTRPQPVMFVAPRNLPDSLDAVYAGFSPLVPSLQRLTPAEVAAACPAFDRDSTSGGVREPGALEIDVHALLTGYARTVRNNGGHIETGLAISTFERIGARWAARSGDREVSAGVIVNAAGAWGDVVARAAGVAPLGLRPLLRSVFTFATDRDARDWPLVVDADEQWYFKPEGPNVLGSAASEIPSEPVDARAPELDVALGIEKLNDATNLAIRSVRNTWAGLRTFTTDRTPAVGFDADAPGFFWIVGQGGYGIKTSPAIGELAASLILDAAVPDHTADRGITAEMLSPARLR